MTENLWNKIFVKPFTDKDIHLILETLYPELNFCLVDIIKSFKISVDIVSETSYSLQGALRRLTLRDLLKLCKRLQKRVINSQLLNCSEQEIKEVLFREALDCFVGMVSSQNEVQKI